MCSISGFKKVATYDAIVRRGVLEPSPLIGNSCGESLERARRPLYVAPAMRREVQIVNELGLHARPAAEFVRCAMRFQSEIVLRRGDERFSAASILEVLSANLDCGARVVLEAI